VTAGLILVCLASGMAIGFLGGVLGIGGGLIAIPALVLLLDMPQQLAQGTALVMVLPTILMAVRKYNQNTPIPWSVAFTGAACAVLSTWVGARLALDIPSASLRRSFAVFLCFVGLFYVWQTWFRGQPANADAPGGPRLTPKWGAVLGTFGGTLGGFFGVGGAVLMVPVLTAVFRQSQTRAQALALAMIIPGASIALITYSWAGQAAWHIGLPLAAGSLLCVPMGVRAAYKLPERGLRACFAAMLFATVALLIYE
jgi:uncharacterized membrane protein YfcA